MIVAGFELTTIVRKPSSRSTFSAWQPAESNSQAWPITIGPEPIRQIDLMSVLRGIAHLRQPALEDRPGIVRPRPRLRMELDRACVQIGEVEALDRAVVEGDVRRLCLVRGRDRETVILARDENAAAPPLQDRM